MNNEELEIKNRIFDLKLSIKERIKWVEETFNFYLKIHLEYQWKPFVKSFKNWAEYRKWEKKQKNPLFWK